MGDEPQAPAQVPDTPEAQPDPYEQRYNDLRSDYDRKTPLAAQWTRFQEDPAYQAQVLSELGYQIEPDEEPDPDPDGYEDPNAARIEALEQRLAAQETEREQTAAQQRDVTHIGQGLQQLTDTLGRDLTEQEIHLLGDAAYSRRTADGLPDIKSVAEHWLAVREHDQKTWAQTKQAPHTTPGGQTAEQDPYPDGLTDTELAERMAEKVRAMTAQ